MTPTPDIDRFQQRIATVADAVSQPATESASALAEPAKHKQRDIRLLAWDNFLDEGCLAAYREKRFSTFQVASDPQAAALAECERFAETLPERIAQQNNLVLFGPCGTGKDHLAVSICRVAILRHGLSARFLDAQDWFGEVRDAMNPTSPKGESALIGLASRPDVLLLSDPAPQFEGLTSHQANMLFRVLNRRERLGRITIVTANVRGISDAKEKLGGATWDRMARNAWRIFFGWPGKRCPARNINCQEAS